ncbi:MAG: flagellin [Gallionella sp.]|nr:flagellin [Gallionella sp.]
MPSFINTNLASLNAQRNLNSSQTAQSTALQRLSSGLRINSAKDDAAGMAISARMTAQIHGTTQAARNANDGISLAQTAEGSMNEVTSNLQRIRDLAVQSRNASNSVSDRTALNAEAQSLISEIDRVSNTTSFNGVKLMDGTFTGQAFQVGANSGESISINKIVNSTSTALGVTSVTAAASTIAATTATNGFAGALAAGDVKINGVDIGAIAAAGSAAERGAQIAAAANAVSGQTGVLATVASTGVVTFNNYGSVPTNPALPAVINTGITLALAGTGTVANTGITAQTATAASVTAGAGFSGLDLTSVAGADAAIAHMDNAMTAINSARSDMGALQNRFASVVNNLQTTTENLTASRSRIQDTDFAAETASLSRSQILQQAGTAMLAQANQLPSQVMTLLR